MLKITKQLIGEYEVNSINARDVWKAIESKQQFGNWIKNRLETYGFEEELDYVRVVTMSNSERNLNFNKNIKVGNDSNSKRNLNFDKNIKGCENVSLSDLKDNSNIIIFKKNQKLQGKQTEYIVSLDMAKELAMLEGNKNGREVRKYLIEFERQASIEIKILKEQIQSLRESSRISKDLIRVLTKKVRPYEIREKISELEEELEELKQQGYY